jgi:pyruvate dehydrogenase E1 component beta subunit
MVKVALAAAELLAAEGIEAEVVDPRTIRPLDEELIVESVKKTGRCLILEEGWPFNGVGAEIAYRVQRLCFDDLDHPVERLTSLDVPAPYNRKVEASIRPDPEKAVRLVKKVLYLE